MDKLIFSTLLHLVYWDGSDAHIIHTGSLEEGTAHYHGITWNEDGMMYVSGCDDFHYVLYTFQLPFFQLKELISGDLHEPHSIFYRNGAVYVTNTGKNRVEILENGAWRHVAWNPSPCDIEHINAIWSDGRHFFVAEHGQTVERGSIIRVCTLDLDLLIENIHIGPNIHNVYVEEGSIYTLTSFDKGEPAGIIVTDLLTKDHRRIDKSEWGQVLLRGLARTEGNWYFGMSRWEEDRSKRPNGDAIIVQLDNDFNELERLTFPNYGPVCAVRVMGARDFAHNGITVGAWDV